MTEVFSMLGISEKEDLVDACVPFTGEGICPTCKHEHKYKKNWAATYEWNAIYEMSKLDTMGLNK